MKDMYDYIMETPDAIREVIEKSKQNNEDCIRYIKGKKIGHIYLVASGTSYSAALSCIKPIEKLMNIPVYAVYAMEFVDNTDIVEDNALVIGISQAGQSSSTIQALDKAKEMGCLTLACSAQKDVPVTAHADSFLKIEVEEDIGPKTKGYYCSVIAILMLFLELSKEDSEKWISKILGTIDLIPDIAKTTKQWYESEKEELKRFKNIIVIGYDKCLPAATEGALKILETVQCCVRYYELEEFMHGIYHGIDKSTLILALGNQSRHLNRMVRLLGYLKEHKNATTYLISQNKVTKHDFSYPFIEDSLFGSFEYLTVLQVLGELMCHDRGIDLYDTADENFHEYMESYVYEK